MARRRVVDGPSSGERVNDRLEIYGSGRRLHELAGVITSSPRLALTGVRSPIEDESHSSGQRYAPDLLDVPPDVLVTHLVDPFVCETLLQGMPMILVPPIAVLSGIALDRIASDVEHLDIRVGPAPWMSSRCLLSSFVAEEVVPIPTMLCLIHGLESRDEHLLGRLAYPIAISCLVRGRTPSATPSIAELCPRHAEARVRQLDTRVTVRIAASEAMSLSGSIGEVNWHEIGYTRLATDELAARIHSALEDIETSRRFGRLNVLALASVRGAAVIRCACE